MLACFIVQALATLFYAECTGNDLLQAKALLVYTYLCCI